MKILFEMLSYPFMVRAMIVGILVSLCASMLGLSLVLKRYSMIGDGLSKVSFASLALATVLNLAPLQISIPIVLIVAFFLLKISENSQIKGDAAIAFISSASLAIGVMLISLSTGINTDVCNYLFGTVLGLTRLDVYLTVVLSFLVMLIYLFFYRQIFSITLDENFARASGLNVTFYKMLIALMTALIIVLGMKTMGSLLISSLIIFPSLTAMRIFKTFKTVIIASMVIAFFSFVLGMMLSYLIATPTGASITIINLVLFIIFSLVAIIIKRL